MKIISFLTLVFALTFTFCKSDKSTGPEPEEINANITELETALAKQATPEPETLEKLLLNYEKQVAAHPDRENANALFLMKAAETATTLRKYDKALALYEQIRRTCPRTDKVAHALFMQGFVYDNYLQKDDSARILYKRFITIHPKDEFVDDAQVLLDNLGKSDEEMLENIQKKREKNSGKADTVQLAK